MMTESGDQNIGWQDEACAGESSSEGDLPSMSEVACESNEKARKSRLPGDSHSPMTMRQVKLVAGACNPLALLYTAIGLTEQKLAS